MRLSSRILKNVDTVNSFHTSEAWTVRVADGEGEAVSLYYQIIDLDRDGLRYMPQAGATAEVTFPSIDDDLTVVATQPFPQDPSIWVIQLTADDVPSTGNVRFSLTESGTTRRWVALNSMQSEKINAGGC